MPKYILNPGPVTMIDPATDEPIPSAPPATLGDFIRGSLLLDKRWSEDLAWMRAKSAVMRATKPSKGDQPYLELEPDVYERLAQVARSPQGGYQGYNPVLLDQFLPFLEAVVDAKDRPPAPAQDVVRDSPAEK